MNNVPEGNYSGRYHSVVSSRIWVAERERAFTYKIYPATNPADTQVVGSRRIKDMIDSELWVKQEGVTE